jgi:hypothetical protein
MENEMSGIEFKKKYEYEKSLYSVAPSYRPRVDAKVINDFNKHNDVRRTNIKMVK